jgi:Flp pilus assembly protein TadD
MKKQLFFALTVLVAVVFSSCKNMTDLDPTAFTATPNPLEVKAGKVDATITGSFPVKYFKKNAVVTVTPVLKMSNGNSVKGTPSVFQGEKVKGNNNVISYKAGGSYTMKATFNYVPEMAVSELFLEFDVVAKKKTYSLKPVKVADGVIATAEMIKNELKSLGKAVYMADKFERDIMEMTEADILFLIQQSNIRSTELKSEGVVALTKKIVDARDALNKSIQSLNISAYASPDGGLDLNTKLAEARQKETEKFINSELKKMKSPLTVESKFTPEDWDGFRKLMEKSNIQDKDLILRVLSMYTDPEQREREIKNLAAAYKQIADDVLPQLRRSQLKLVVKVTGKSDEEIAKLAKEDASQLNLEEMLYAGALATSLNDKAAIYQKVVSAHPQCARGHNNLGVVRFAQGNADAAKHFAKALELMPNNADINYNNGLIAMQKNDLAQAQVYFGKAAGTAGNLKNAMGSYYTTLADYARAKTAFGDTKTNNAALLHILNKEYSTAKSTLAGVAEPDAMTAYLSAIVAARTNDKDGVFSNLKTAVTKDKTLAAKAGKDVEFAKYWNEAAFQSIVK